MADLRNTLFSHYLRQKEAQTASIQQDEAAGLQAVVQGMQKQLQMREKEAQEAKAIAVERGEMSARLGEELPNLQSDALQRAAMLGFMRGTAKEKAEERKAAEQERLKRMDISAADRRSQAQVGVQREGIQERAEAEATREKRLSEQGDQQFSLDVLKILNPPGRSGGKSEADLRMSQLDDEHARLNQTYRELQRAMKPELFYTLSPQEQAEIQKRFAETLSRIFEVDEEKKRVKREGLVSRSAPAPKPSPMNQDMYPSPNATPAPATPALSYPGYTAGQHTDPGSLKPDPATEVFKSIRR